MARFYAARELEWKGNRLIVGGRNDPSAGIVPDDHWPGMWRVKRPDGSLTDMVNRSRARDAAGNPAYGVKQSRNRYRAPARAFAGRGCV